MAEQDPPFDAFLSYNSKDRPAVIRLAARMKAQGLKVWLDVEELIPGRPWQEALESNIKSIHAAAVLVGKEGIGPWQSREMRSYLRKFVEHGKPVIPVLLEGCPETPELPLFLEDLTWVDCRDGKEDEGFWRLVWGVTGKKPVKLSASDQASPAANQQSANPIPAPESSKPLIQPRPTKNQRAVNQATAQTQPTIFRDALKSGDEGPEMVIVPRGTFRMGDLGGGGDADERPVHTVTFAQPFAIGRYAVTFEEYDRFATATRCRMPDDFGWGRSRRPVVDVTWEDAGEYARWLSEQTGKPYRLPSEAEWEYAARAGTETAYWWGDEIGVNRANCFNSGSEWSGKQTAPVGSFLANPWGLHDTAGNVWEWAQDRWHDSYQGAPDDGSAWEVGGGSSRVLRGGSWSRSPHLARCAFRSDFDPGSRNNVIGFRLVCASPVAGH